MYRVFGNQCTQCRAELIAPEWSEHLSDYCIRHVWLCEACGCQFEDAVCLSATFRRQFEGINPRKTSGSLAMFAAILPDVGEGWPSLLVRTAETKQ